MTDPRADDPIGALLRDLADPPSTVEDTWHVVLARSGQARRRRRATRLGGLAGAVVVSGAMLASIALRPADGVDVVIDPASTATADARPAATTSSSTDSDPAAGPTVSTTVASAIVASTTADKAIDAAGSSTVPSTTSVSTGVGDGASRPSSDLDPVQPLPATTSSLRASSTTASTAPPAAPSTSSPSPPSPSTIPATIRSTTSSTVPSSSTLPAGETLTYRLVGGVAVVGWDGRRLSLQSTTPAAGYRVVVDHADADEIELSFVGAGRLSSLHVELEDGRPSPEISER